MKNSFEAIFSKKGKKPSAPEKPAGKKQEKGFSELEKATNIKKEIVEITQGKNLDDLPIEDLKVIWEKYRAMESSLGLSETEPKGDTREQMLKAKEIMGDDFFAHQEIEKAFGIKLNPEKIPEIPFSKEDLERAKELGQFLVLRVDKDNDGKPLTIEKMDELLNGKVKDGAKVLYSGDGSGKIKDDAWYKNEDFALKETPKFSWALTSKEVIADSTSKNYLDQTEKDVEYLKDKVFKGKKITTEFQTALSEFEKAKSEIGELIKSDWKKASEKLEGLKITKLIRQTPVEAVYDLLIYFQNKGERLMGDKYTWTSRRASVGELVLVGSFDSDGVHVSRFTPGLSSDNLGVSFSRSL